MSSHLSKIILRYVKRRKRPDKLKETTPLLQEPTLTTCRIDHYQTPTLVHVSVFAKQVDKEKSTIQIEESQVGAPVKLM